MTNNLTLGEASNLIDIAGVMMVTLDRDANITMINPRGCEVLGYSHAESINQNWFNFCIPEDNRKEVEKVFHQLMNGKVLDVKVYQNDVINKAGELRNILFQNAVTTNSDGVITGVLFSGEDVTHLNVYKEQLEKSLIGTILVLSKAVEVRDPYTAGHERRVAKLSCAIAEMMSLDEKTIEGINVGALIHDVGKIHIPSELLAKPSVLSAIEFELIKVHAVVGYEILKDIDFPWPVALIAYQHHERIDGTGYPNGLTGDEMCLEAKIVAVADVVEAMNSHRPYRAGLGIDAALDEIKKYRGKYYAPEAVDACLKVFSNTDFSFE